MTLRGIIDPDVAASLDPYLFAFGFLLTAAGLMLSQIHRDEGILMQRRSGLLFSGLRKVSALEVLVAVVLGFWIIGIWWLLWLPILVAISSAPVALLRQARHRLPVMATAMIVGLALLFWTQGPVLPRIF